MKVLQHYYTSFVNRETGRAGFQVKAMSSDISPEMQTTIARLIAYRIPAKLEERAIATHPVAFRYFYLNPQECILLCSQSCGNDENGRPGNFFAHSVVLPPDEFVSQPPILYWHSPFWRKQATETQIKPLSTFDAETSDHIIDEMWDFLAGESRREAFYNLMCAVVQSERTKRRIIIIDSEEHVALWIAAVSCMLPPSCRPLLSFATYHHDPYQSWFLITGTPDDSIFRATPEESISHFVLDGRTCNTSPVEESLYAQLIRNCTPQSYEKHMLGYFWLYEQRFPTPSCIDEQLNLFVNYLALHEKKNSIAISDMLQAISVVLTKFENLSVYNDDDRKELEVLKDALKVARQRTGNANITKVYDHVVRLYQKHKMPTDDILQGEFQFYTKQLLVDQGKGASEEAITRLEQLPSLYGDAMVVQCANQKSYLQYLVEMVQGSSYSKWVLLWSYIGAYLRPDSHSQRLFEKSIYTWENLLQSRQKTEANKLFAAIKHAIAGKEMEWLRLLVAAATPQTAIMVKHFYWQLASPLSLKQREPYRAIVQQQIPTIVEYELSKELDNADLDAKIAVISRIAAYVAQQPGPYDVASLVNEGLDKVERGCNTNQWRKLALDILLHDDLLPFLSQKEDRLIEKALSGLTLQEFSFEKIHLYKRYRDHTSLSLESKNVLAAMIAMAEGLLDAAVVAQVYTYVSSLLSSEMYREEIRCFIDAFFEHDINEENHFLMVSALYVWHYREQFWRAYWNKVYVMLTRLLTNDLERVVRLFAFWFAYLPDKAMRPDQYYVSHQFFLEFQHHLSKGATLEHYSDAMNNLVGKATSYPWYPLIQELLQARKKGMVERGQELVRFVQRKIPMQKSDEQTQELEKTANTAISSLLTKGSTREQHMQNVLNIYNHLGGELFWSIYTKQLTQMLTAKDSDHLLEVYDFWFNSSFRCVGQQPYIAQEFFIRASQVFENALKEYERDFRETAKVVLARCEPLFSRGEGYSWYPIIRPFLMDAQPTRRWFR